eukprot:TRINITY_DN14722_c0_g4_i1.p1 TRINITY_DN14722_c0_g4~~TRINITY_DN14722_c0_g4_i1.p1  ORF type:complete len:620 (+),score=114.30 TRINITY_DN14722_c0_g4_i1:130-1860(+)
MASLALSTPPSPGAIRCRGSSRRANSSVTLTLLRDPKDSGAGAIRPVASRSVSLPRGSRGSVASAGSTAIDFGVSSGTPLASASAAAASLLLGSTASASFQSPVVLRVSVTSAFDIRAQVTVNNAHAEHGEELPAFCPANGTVQATYVAASLCKGDFTKGQIQIDGFPEPVDFAVSHRGSTKSYVGSSKRWRHTALCTEEPWDWRNGADKPAEGRAADIEMRAPWLMVKVRTATVMELKRCCQQQALREAAACEDYDMLHAQVTKAMHAGVEHELIQKGEARLKELMKLRLHISPGCERDTIRELMQWGRVTSRCGDPEPGQQLCSSADCPCNEDTRHGEVLALVDGGLQRVLGPESDRILFEELVEGALAAEEGCVWRAGGKFIFSAFTRNQSIIALIRMLEGNGRKKCAKMMKDLAKHSEESFGGYVTAVQVNFHMNGETKHDQHRDIYSAKQRAGPSCTCSFRECLGTICYTLGSSRHCLLETQTDDISSLTACCNGCTGKSWKKWLHSGVGMYFNDAWNQNHLHGIPMMDEAVGPRISIAFLLGADPNAKTALASRPSDLQALLVGPETCPA